MLLRRRTLNKRIAWSVVVILAAALIPGARLYFLQIDQHAHYRTLSEGNRFRDLAVPPVRGHVYDRHGRLLAANRTVHKLTITPQLAGDPDALLARLGALVSLSDAERAHFSRERARVPAHRQIVLKSALTDNETARLAVELHRLGGVEIVGELARVYPRGEAFAHVVGYLGKAGPRDPAVLAGAGFVARGVGKAGVERQYDGLLRGAPGLRRVEVNAQGRVLRTVAERAPRTGDDILLSLDYELQKAAYDALEGWEGAVVAVDPASGEVLAMVSRPSFDPNRFIAGFSPAEYARLSADPRRPFFNRAIAGQYPPGSVVKPVVALASLASGAVTHDHYMFAGPYYTAPGHERRFRDWKKEGHGWVGLREAIAQSCDVFFYDMAYRTGIDKLSVAFRDFGLGRATGLDLPGEVAGLVPDRKWKRRHRNLPWFPEDTVIVGIGQGALLATPMQLAAAAAALATRGQRATPRLLRATRAADGAWRAPPAQAAAAVETARARDWEPVIDAMADVVHRPNGTARRIGTGLDYTIAGKTGTAQVRALPEELPDNPDDVEQVAKRLRHHALFIAFAPVDAPSIAVAVVVEHGESGARAAAPVARRVLDAHFARRAPSAGPGAGPSVAPSERPL